jgi:outer membrane immunogenic protein
MKLFVVALVFSFFVGWCRAVAAEFPPPAPMPANPPAPYERPSNMWGGFYIGLNGGGGFGSSQWTLGGIGTSVFNTGGFLLGGTVGFNYPISEVLVGLEGDLDWSTFDGSASGCAVNSAGGIAACETKNNWLGTARARAGYALDRMMIFVTGGAAFGGVQTGLNPPATFDTATHVGWTAGAGVEYALSPAWIVKAEYLFVDFNNASCVTVANCGTAAGATAVLTENLLRAGINYKFSW